MLDTFTPGVDAPDAPGPADSWFVFAGDRLLTRSAAAPDDLVRGADLVALGLDPTRRHYLGLLDGHACFAGEVATPAALPEGWTWGSLRGFAARADADLFALAGRAAQILEWDRTHAYCGRCGTPVAPLPGERAKRCSAWGLVTYPRIAPAVIVRTSAISAASPGPSRTRS